MNPSRLLALADHIADTDTVYIVTADGQVKPTRVDVYLGMTARELRGTLVQSTERGAERASLRVRGIETFEIQRN